MSPLGKLMTFARLFVPDALIDRVVKKKAESGFDNN